eukprot:g1263.t1
MRIISFLAVLAVYYIEPIDAGAGGGADCGKNTTSYHHGVFGMGDHLEHLPAFVMMAFIIVFTIFCEQTLAAGRRWTNYHNPLMQPFLDKVVSELMILGSTAFAILIYNECTENSLSNGEAMPESWYHTLHWIDTVIFIFAIFYVIAAAYTVGLLTTVLHWLAPIDAQSSKTILSAAGEDLSYLQRLRMRKLLQYNLIKARFKSDFFHDPKAPFDFVFYLEVSLINGIAGSFSIDIADWLILLVSMLPVIKSVGGVECYEIFTIACGVLWLVTALIIWFLMYAVFYQSILTAYGINPHSLVELTAALAKVVEEGNDNNRAAADAARIADDKAAKALLHSAHPDLLRQDTAAHFDLKPKTASVRYCGIKLDTSTFVHIVKWELQVTCFYLAVHLVAYVDMYALDKLPGSVFWLCTLFIVLNLCVLMPIMFLLGFSLAAIVNLNAPALAEMRDVGKEAEHQLLYFKAMILSELEKKP